MNSERIHIVGKCSIFGGPNDSGMTQTEGLALYEHHEADKRPELFFPRDRDLAIGTSKRLRPEAFYIAIRFDRTKKPRSAWQWQQFIVSNKETGEAKAAFLVDWGPAEWTKRAADLSPGLARALNLKTDEEVIIIA